MPRTSWHSSQWLETVGMLPFLQRGFSVLLRPSHTSFASYFPVTQPFIRPSLLRLRILSVVLKTPGSAVKPTSDLAE